MTRPRISVIVPALDEAHGLGPVLTRAAAADPWELIVADGGSTDGTGAVARAHGARVVVSTPGRGRQMNRGAAAATGDVLLFLHADTYLPPGYERHVTRILAGRGIAAGAFALRIDARHRALRVVERVANWRARALGMPYGDQAIFLWARTFRRVGGYPETAAMEDFEIMRRLRRHGRVVTAPAPVVTSARRWLEHGVWRTTLLNQACVGAYVSGVSTERIARWRGLEPRPVPRPRGDRLDQYATVVHGE